MVGVLQNADAVWCQLFIHFDFVERDHAKQEDGALGQQNGRGSNEIGTSGQTETDDLNTKLNHADLNHTTLNLAVGQPRQQTVA